MMKTIYISIIVILCISMFTGCGQLGDFHNPVGLTGGSDGGYGKRSSFYYNSSIPQNDNSVEGIWTGTDRTLKIDANGTFEFRSDEAVRTGTYNQDKDKLILNFTDGFSVTYVYTLQQRRLILDEKD